MPRAGGGKAPSEDRQSDPPLVCNGWRILVWGEFRQTWASLRAEVASLAEKSPDTYKEHPATIFLRDVRDIILTEVPSDPGADRYQQGNKLGAKYRHWRRAKFRRRFPLFFRYSTSDRAMDTLRTEGDGTDVYAVFRSMLARHSPPTDWNQLIAECELWPGSEIDGTSG